MKISTSNSSFPLNDELNNIKNHMSLEQFWNYKLTQNDHKTGLDAFFYDDIIKSQKDQREKLRLFKTGQRKYVKYLKRIQYTLDKLHTNVYEWAVGKCGREVWPRIKSISVCQLCGYKHLHNQFWLFNAKRLITIQVGCECVCNWVEVKNKKTFVSFFDTLMVDEFRDWLSTFFSEYRIMKSLNTLTKTEKQFSQKVYETSKTLQCEDASYIKSIYKKAQKLGYTLPPRLFGYGIFDHKGYVLE